MENLSAIFANRGMYSLIRMPGTLVSMALWVPRRANGASGLGSKVS